MSHYLREPRQWDRIRDCLGWNPADRRVAFSSLPFGPGDATVGTELELQAVVIGDRSTVDLPRTIDSSSYFANLQKRSRAQDTPKRKLRDLERFLHHNPDRVWDNSWVRFPQALLCASAQAVFAHDLLADKSRPEAGPRGDGHRFTAAEAAGAVLRVPVSYLLKLALADSLGRQRLPDGIADTGRRLMQHFLSDNTSPETFSFYIAKGDAGASVGLNAAREVSLRYLLTQALVAYANDRFQLSRSGQHAMVYLSPHPAIRQRELNNCISDGFYRELFMSPCLSGWDQGEAKHDYMRLCHEVLSRSHLNAVAKVRDAGLIASNLVVLPNTSNISLANNGIHISIGSQRLTAMRQDARSGFGRVEEKCVGDLVSKIVEHFVPLFVGTYTGAPYRFDFADFHPEGVLGYLPHELDFTHLRMLWRRWKKKARVSLFGQPISASGIGLVDRCMAALLRLRGDFVPDARIIDYLVAPLSTDESPALDGTLGNSDRLKRDLADQGVFDPRMSLYSFYRLRSYEQLGFCGFEGRYYSLCEDLDGDLAGAVDVQSLVTALAFKYVAEGTIGHSDIPDDPTIESERRQIIFGGAIGIPTFFVRTQTANKLMRRILNLVERTRQSRRYPGYQRVYHIEFRRALIRLIRQDAPELIEALQAGTTLDDLRQRIDESQSHSAVGKLTSGILGELGAKNPYRVSAHAFNRAAEGYYRSTLRRRHIASALDRLRAECRQQPQRMQACWAAVADEAVAHHGPEECYVLRGTVIIDGRELHAGDFHHADDGSDHGEITTTTGADVLIVGAIDDYLPGYEAQA